MACKGLEYVHLIGEDGVDSDDEIHLEEKSDNTSTNLDMSEIKDGVEKLIPRNTIPRKSMNIVTAGVVDMRLEDTRLPRPRNELEEVAEIAPLAGEPVKITTLNQIIT